MIEVLINFGGRLTNERRILPGVYEIGDSRLFGLENYLVDNGFAHWVDPSVTDMVANIQAETGVEFVDFPSVVDEPVEVEGRDGQFNVEYEPLPEFEPDTEQVSEPVEEKQFFSDAWSRNDMIGFAGEFGVDLQGNRSKSAIAPIVESWVVEHDFAEQAAAWHAARHS
jgi:hypothetical protein